MTRLFWTKERFEFAKRMALEGHFCSAIARALGGVTRNAVIGKLHRAGVFTRPNRMRAPHSRVSPRSVKADREYIPPPPPLEEPSPIGPVGATTFQGCQHIHGEPGVGQYCGHPGTPWCAFQKARYLIPQPRTRRRAPGARGRPPAAAVPW